MKLNKALIIKAIEVTVVAGALILTSINTYKVNHAPQIISSKNDSFKDELKNSLQDVIIEEINHPETDSNLIDTLSESVTKRIVETKIVSITDESDLKTQVKAILLESDTTDELSKKIATSVTEQVGDDVSNIDLAKYATKNFVKESESALKSELKNTTDSSKYVTKTDVEKTVKEATESAASNVTYKLTDSDVSKIVAAATKDIDNKIEQKVSQGIASALLSSYRYELTDTDKAEISAAVSTSVSNQIDTMAQEVNSLKTRVSSLETQMTALGTTSGNNISQSAFTSVSNDVETLKTKVAQQESAIENCAKTTDVNSSIGTLNDSVSALETSVSTAEGDIDTLQSDVTTLTNTANSLQTQITENATAITNLQSDVAALQTDTQNALNQLSTLNDTYATDAELNAAKTAIETQINTLSTSAGALNDRVTTIETELSTTYATKAEVATAISNINGAINNLDETYATDSEVNTAISGINTAIEAVSNDLSELSGTVNAYKETVTNTYATIQSLQQLNESLQTVNTNIETLTNSTVTVADYDSWKSNIEAQLLALSEKDQELQDNIDELSSKIVSAAAIGTMSIYAGENPPDGYLLCNGQAVSREEYANLFAAIGTTWGAGDGSTTFNVPDMREVAPVGVGESTRTEGAHDVYTLGQFKDDQLQSHTHTYNIRKAGWYAAERGPEGGLIRSTASATSGDNTGNSGDVTRGKRIGVNYIIKY